MLHARGDVSDSPVTYNVDVSYAPRTWRCFYNSRAYTGEVMVCSTHVEMFLTSDQICKLKESMLHARGDVSHFLVGDMVRIKVCSTHVEMFLYTDNWNRMSDGMLHARGDVSGKAAFKATRDKYAPRTWRCFYFFQYK